MNSSRRRMPRMLRFHISNNTSIETIDFQVPTYTKRRNFLKKQNKKISHDLNSSNNDNDDHDDKDDHDDNDGHDKNNDHRKNNNDHDKNHDKNDRDQIIHILNNDDNFFQEIQDDSITFDFDDFDDDFDLDEAILVINK